jgi:hypothetical protein
MPTLTREIIEAAIAGFEAQKQNIDAQIAELRSMLSGTSASSAPSTKRGGAKRRLSPEALERIREGQRRRWAAAKGGAAAPAKAGKKPKRKLSPEGRKAIVAALKKRWAAKKAAATE